MLFLTARDAVSQRVEALNAGADDYLCKPFAFEELFGSRPSLIAAPAQQSGCHVETFGYCARPANESRERAGHLLQLTAREQALLHFLLRHPGEVLSRTRIYEHVWQDQYDGLSNTLEMHVMELRRKLEMFGPRVIQTVRGARIHAWRS